MLELISGFWWETRTGGRGDKLQGEQNRLDIGNTVISQQRPTCCWLHCWSGDLSPLCLTVPSLSSSVSATSGWDSQLQSHITCHNNSLRAAGFSVPCLLPPVHWLWFTGNAWTLKSKAYHVLALNSHCAYNLGQVIDPVWKWAWSPPKVDVFWLPEETDELLQIKVFC